MKRSLSSIEQADILPDINVEEVTTDADIKDFYVQRQQNQFGYKLGDTIDRMVDMQLQYFKKNRDHIKVFVIRDEKQQVIAGGQLEIQEIENTRRAYLGDKFVVPEARGQRLAAIIVKKRLDAAKESGCQQAYSLIRKDNFAALRSIMKDGFDISSTSKEPGLEKSTASYFASVNFESNERPSSISINKVKEAAEKGLDFTHSELVIPLNNKDDIEKAFRSGYVGKFVLDQADGIADITQEVLYLEKN